MSGLFRLQLEDGAGGSRSRLQARSHGAPLADAHPLANEVTDSRPPLAEELRRDTAFGMGYVDSADGVRLWQEALAHAAARFRCWSRSLQGRAGCTTSTGARGGGPSSRTVAAAARRRRLRHRSPRRHLGRGCAVAEFVARICHRRAVDGAGLFAPEEPLLSAGGSAFYDIVGSGLRAARLSRA
jgi:hypothetical protein